MSAVNRRFHHLDNGQRNEIFHAVDRACRRAVYKYGPLYGIVGRERRAEVNRQAIRFGVPRAVINDIVEHVTARRAELPLRPATPGERILHRMGVL